MPTEKDPVLVAVGNQIRKLRQSRHISQEDFAAKAGLDRSYYGGVERGERNVATANLIRIALALNAEVGELFPRAEDLRAILPEGTGTAGDASEEPL